MKRRASDFHRRSLICGFERLEDRLALATLIQHLDATVFSSVETDGGGNVTQWVDQSGSGNNALADVGDAFFPSDAAFESDALGVDLGSDRTRLELFSAAESDSWLDQSNSDDGFTVLIAFQADAIRSNWNDVIGNSGGVGRGFGMRYSSAGIVQTFIGGSSYNKSDVLVTPDETVVYAFRYDAQAENFEFWDSISDSSLVASVPKADFSEDDAFTLGNTTNRSRYMDGMVGEIKVYDGALTDEEFAAERLAMTSKWTIPGIPANAIRWSQLPNNQVQPNDVVVVQPGETLVLDEDAEVQGLIIMGNFIVDDVTDLELSADWVLVIGGGLFRVGSEQNPYTHEFTLTLEGDNPNFDLDVSQYVPGSSMMISNNNAYLMAMGPGSRVKIYADDAAKESWTQLTQTAQPGDTVIQLEEATGWEVGDRIAIASTDFDLNQAEDFTITAVSNGGRTVTLDSPIQYMHYGEIETYSNGTRTWELDMRAEVALLTRDVTIQGDADSAIDRFGGHTMIMMGAEMNISGAEFTRMGQEGRLGRYPAHWHLLGDASGQYIQHSSFHNTFNKGMTIHGTQNTLINENVVYEHIGHGYFFEDGAEFGNLVTNNLAINARRSDSLEVASERTDFTDVSNFWIENANNTFIGNHAAGSEFEGFRFDLKGINGASEDTGLYDDIDTRATGPSEFRGNVAHSTFEAGLFITTTYVRTVQGTEPTAEDPQLMDVNWGFSDFTSYKGHDTFWPRAIGGDFYDIKLAENSRATRLRLNNTLYDSLIVGRTGNIGTPTTAAEIAAGRSLPRTGNYQGQILYDGPGGVVDTHFDGFDGPGDAAIGLLNAVQKTSYHFSSGLTFGDNVPESQKVDFSSRVNGDVESGARAIIDLDGSLTGYAGAFVTQKMGSGSTINATPNSIARDDWTAWVNPDAKLGSLVFDRYTDDLVRYDIVRSDGAADLNRNGVGDHTQLGFVVDDQYTHTINFYDDSMTEVELYMSDVLSGEGAVFTFIDFDPQSTVTVFNPYSGNSWDAAVVDSPEELLAATTTSVYRGGGSLQIKLVSEMAYGWLWPQPGLLPLQGEQRAGDYNLDGSVNSADSAWWSQSFGQSNTAAMNADGNNDGLVNAADFVVGRDVIGATYENPQADFLGGVTVRLQKASPAVIAAVSPALVNIPSALPSTAAITGPVGASASVATAPAIDSALTELSPELLLFESGTEGAANDAWDAWDAWDDEEPLSDPSLAAGTDGVTQPEPAKLEENENNFVMPLGG
ncbi:MAG: G8 domain-containing protein [Planctomycetota bacterium]